jgi:hypothetical protein
MKRFGGGRGGGDNKSYQNNNKNNKNNNYNISPFNKLLLICNISYLLFLNFTSLSPLTTCNSTCASDDSNNVVSSSSSLSFFDKAADHLFEIAMSTSMSTSETASITTSRKEFPTNLNDWNLTTLGGLSNNDRIVLGNIYSKANSIFEYGLGESTSIAAYVQVPRYSGIDSDPAYVATARSLAPNYFRFYFADIGPTKSWGYPRSTLPKNKFNYQISSLLSEINKPFDVYMVDGRYRVPCVFISLLHASSRSSIAASASSSLSTSNNSSGPIILLHDCIVNLNNSKRHRKQYASVNTLLDMIDTTADKLCVYQRKSTTTDQMIYDMWMKYQDEIV